jgi:hypothetical protein
MDMKLNLWCILLVSIVIATQATAFALDCDGGIVSVGDLVSDVLRKCGQPTSATQREQVIVNQIANDHVITPIITDDWIYNFGPARFQYRILLRNDRVLQIESLGYGY